MDRNAASFAASCRALLDDAGTRAPELAEAWLRLHGDEPPPGALDVALEVVAYEWVDARGYTTAERVVAAGGPAALLDLAQGVRASLWVVDAGDRGRVRLRDLDSDEVIEVEADAALLPARSVVHGRVAPWEGEWRFLGEPGVYAPRGVIGRAELHAAWRNSRGRDLAVEMATLRSLFRRQREERRAWIAFFGADAMCWPSAAAMEADLVRFAHHLAHVDRPRSLGGRTRAEAARRPGRVDAQVFQLRLGPTLLGAGQPGAIFDDVEGLHFLPGWGEFRGWAEGSAAVPAVLQLYLSDPGISRLPFRRARAGPRLAAALGADLADLERLLDDHKPTDGRAVPSLFPSPGDDGP